MMECNDDEYIACLCEGTAEEDIMKWLLEENKLVFSKEQMIEQKPLRIRSAKVFQKKYLTVEYGAKKIKVIRILDSKNERFKLAKCYADKVSVINIITAPEIEILAIIKAKDYQKYTNKYKSQYKPSDYCKMFLGLKNVKEKGFIKKYFCDINTLIDCIKEYDQLSSDNDFISLSSLLKK